MILRVLGSSAAAFSRLLQVRSSRCASHPCHLTRLAIAPHGLREGSGHLNPVFDLWQYPAATGHRLRFRDNPRADRAVDDPQQNKERHSLDWVGSQASLIHRKAALTGWKRIDDDVLNVYSRLQPPHGLFRIPFGQNVELPRPAAQGGPDRFRRRCPRGRASV